MENNFTLGLEEAMKNLCTTGAFLTVSQGDKVNSMTISWGSVGFMWRKPMFMALVRESRYSNEFLKTGATYTVSIPYGENMKKALSICGTKSGRNVDKKVEAGINYLPSKKVATPIVDNCNKYYECKVMLSQPMDLDKLDKDIVKSCYGEGETKHILYFGEILETYKK